MKVEQLLKFNSSTVTEIILRDEHHTRVATIDYDMNMNEAIEMPLHIDDDNKFYGTNVVLPEYVQKLTVDFFINSKVCNYDGKWRDGIRVFCRCPKL